MCVCVCVHACVCEEILDHEMIIGMSQVGIKLLL